MHGWTATVSVSVPFGTTTWFDPGGIAGVLPGTVVSACEHGGTTIARSLRCRGTTTVRTPGVWSAIDVGS